MTLYSQLLMAGVVGDGAPLIEEVPSGFVWVVRDIFWVFETSGTGALSVFDTLTNASIMYLNVPPANQSDFHWTGRQVLYAGMNLEALTVGADFASVRISGYALTAP